MAVKQLNDNRDFDWEEYIIDSPNDVSNLPTTCGWGSTAICIFSGDVYILNSSKEWTLLGLGESATAPTDSDILNPK